LTATNSEARKRILGRIRKGLGRQELTEDQLQALRKRDESPRTATQHRQAGSPLARFCRNLEASGGSFERVDSEEAAVSRIVNLKNLEYPEGKIVSAPALSQLPWPDDLDIQFGSVSSEVEICVNQGLCAIAETGSVVLASDPTTPTLLNFLGETQVVLVSGSRLVEYLEEGWAMIRHLEHVPRAVNLVSGPSKTADVEQTLQIGAHGPCRFHVLIVEADLQ
jgi:L-lactate utilization protein LutC